MAQAKTDAYSKRLLNSISAPLEDDSDSDFRSGPYIEPPTKPKKKGRKSFLKPPLKKRRTTTKIVDSEDEEPFNAAVKEKKVVLPQGGPFDPNPLKKYFAGMLDFLSVSDGEADNEEEPEEDSEGSDSDTSNASNPVAFLNLQPVKPASSSKEDSGLAAETDSVTESSSYEGPNIGTSQVSNRDQVSAASPQKKNVVAIGNMSDSVTESESDVAPVLQVPPKARAKSPAKPTLSAVARGKLPQARAEESSSVTESESDPELDFTSKTLKRRPNLPLRVGQKVVPLILDKEKKVKVPSTLNTFLRDYQRNGVEFLYKQYEAGKGGLLGDDMGLVRKTIQTISFLSAIMRKTGLASDRGRRRDYVFKLQDNENWRTEMPNADAKWPTCLIIAPSSVTGNWEREFQKWGYFEVGMYIGPKRADFLKDFKLGRLDVVVTSFEIATQDIEELYDLAFTCVVVDEVHRLKDKRRKTAQACARFVTRRRYGLTGTAIQNNYDEFWAILDWTNQDELGTLKQWRGYVTKPLVAAQSTTATDETQAIGTAVASILRDKLLPDFFLRRTKDIIKDQMPKKTDQVVFCPLTRMQARAYKNILSTPAVRNLVKRDEPCDCGSVKARKNCHYPFVAADVFKYMSILIKLSNHLALILPVPKDNDETVRACREIARIAFPGDDNDIPTYLLTAMSTETCGKWAVLDTLLNEWRRDKKNKVLIFTKSVKLLNIVGDYLKKKLRYTYLKLDGSTKQESRMDLVDQFNNDPDIFIFLISTAAGGTGLNLTGANKVVIFDPNWNPALDLQAMDRAFRIGQLRDVTVYRLLGAGSVEELIYARQIYKQQQMAIGYDASIQTRYFEGVQGDNAKKGELFGLENIFKLHEGAVATQHVIEKAHISELDWALANIEKQKGKKKRNNELVEAAEQFNDEDAGILREDKDTLKGLGLLLFDDDVPKPKKDDIEETLKQIGVQYTHQNNHIIAPSHVQAMKLDKIIENLKKRKRESAAASSSRSRTGNSKGKKKETTQEIAKAKPSVPWPPPNRGKNRKPAAEPIPSQLEMRREALVATGVINCAADIYTFAREFNSLISEERIKVLEMVDREAERLEREKAEESSSD